MRRLAAARKKNNSDRADLQSQPIQPPEEIVPKDVLDRVREKKRQVALVWLKRYVEKYKEVPSISNWNEARLNDSEFDNAPASSTIKYYFNTWNRFIKAGGYEPNELGGLKPSNDEEVTKRKNRALQYLHAYIKKYKEVPSVFKWEGARKNDSEFENAPSLRTIVIYFNTWNRFIKAGGHAPNQRFGKLSDEEVTRKKDTALKYLQKYVRKYGEVPSCSDWNEARLKDPEFENAQVDHLISYHFTTWNEFIKTGGYEPNKELLSNQEKQQIEQLFRMGKSYREISLIVRRSAPAVRTNLKKLGLYSSRFIKKHIASISVIISREIDGVKLYDGQGKKRIRGMMLESTVDHLSNPFDVNYIGFPSANFVDYSLLYDEIGVSPEESLAVERERRIANIMRSIIDNFAVIIGGERFEGLNLHKGPLVRAVSESPEMQFNFFSLDFLGGWSPGKERSVDLLFANGQVADEAVMFLSLNNSLQERMRLLRGRGPVPSYGTDNQYILATNALKLAAQRSGFAMQELFTTEYQDSRIPMLVIGARFERAEI